jgi:hypothetical protein
MGIRGFHDTNIPGDSQGNGVAENNDRDIKSGTVELLSHAGMPLAYWPYALSCYCFGHNVVVVDGVSPYGKRFGENFDQSKMFVFGSTVRFIPSSVTGDKTEQFAESTQPGIFMRYGVNCGCIWSREYLVARTKEFRDMNYHTGRRKGDDIIIKVQWCANAYRDDATTDALFDYPLREKHTLAFSTLDGWLDSWWHSDDIAAGLVVPDENGMPVSAADEMRRAGRYP